MPTLFFRSCRDSFRIFLSSTCGFELSNVISTNSSNTYTPKCQIFAPKIFFENFCRTWFFAANTMKARFKIMKIGTFWRNSSFTLPHISSKNTFCSYMFFFKIFGIIRFFPLSRKRSKYLLSWEKVARFSCEIFSFPDSSNFEKITVLLSSFWHTWDFSNRSELVIAASIQQNSEPFKEMINNNVFTLVQ